MSIKDFKLKALTILFILGITSIVTLVSCKKDKDDKEDPVPQPAITAFTPDAGPAGTQVTISGVNFSSKAVENTVDFNGTSAEVISATSTQLIVSAPLGAGTGKINVKVNGLKATSQNEFKVTVIPNPPTFASFAPTSGEVGTTVTLTGTNFSTTASENSVKFNGTAATVSAATATALTVAVPPGSKSGKITVEVKGVTLSSAENFTVIVPLSIASISPASGVVGTQVTIKGASFSTTASENVVKFNGTTAQVTAATDTTITTTVPSGATTGKVSVTVNGGTVNSSADFAIPAPTITSFAPAYGVPGANFTITGSNFSTISANDKVKLNDVDATVTAATETSLTVTVPALATSGKIKIDVGGQSVTSVTDFEVLKDIPRNGLVAFYPFTGNANDASGNSLNGTVNGAVLTTDRFGRANNSYNFDGVNDNINMNNPSLLHISNKITVSGWININAFKSPPTPGSNSMAIITKIFFDPTAGGNPKKGYFINQDFFGNGTPSLNTYIYSSSGSTTTSYVGQYATLDTDPPTITNWIHFALIIDGQNFKFYKNGVKTTDINHTATLMDSGAFGNMTIGSYGSGFFFNGKIDDVAIYNRPLDSAEIQKLYEQTVSKY